MIIDVTFLECIWKLDDVAQLEFAKMNIHVIWLLHLEDEEGAFSIECLIFEATEQESPCLI